MPNRLSKKKKKWMPTAADIHYAKQSEAMGGDGNYHLSIRKIIKPPMRHGRSLLSWPQTSVGRGKRRYIHFVRT